MRTGGRPLACRQSFWRFSASSRGTGPRSDEPEPVEDLAAADQVAVALPVQWPAPQAPAAADQVVADRAEVAADRAVAQVAAADRLAGTAAGTAGAMATGTAAGMAGATAEAVINRVSLR
jgi:hypothetical protein